MVQREKVREATNWANKAVRLYAILWQHLYAVSDRFTFLKTRYGASTTTAILLSLVAISYFLIPVLQGSLTSVFSTDEMFAGFRTLLLTLGGSLVGAAAIAFSLVMFAMQVNVERMPYGLFRKFSSDSELLVLFLATLLISIGVATLSLIPDRSWLGVGAVIATWGIVLVPISFFRAYRRALDLISPTKQLEFITAHARRDLHAWERRSKHAAPLFESSHTQHQMDDSLLQPTHDFRRVAYFRLNPQWTAEAQKAILHSISFARRYAEQGDHEISDNALRAIVAINRAYVSVKGKTFFATEPLIENPLSNDGFILETLEHLRRNIHLGISRGDEVQVEQTLRAIASLCEIYATIDYGTVHGSRTNTLLANEYLSTAVESVLPHNMPDVVMEGVRLMGKAAEFTLDQPGPTEITAIAKRISLISCTAFAKEGYRPITLTGMEQLAKLTYDLMRSRTPDIRSAAAEIRSGIGLTVRVFLNVSDTSLSSVHSACLAPYYSCLSSNTFPAWLTDLVNALLSAEADNDTAKRIIRNIQQWADRLYQAEKDTFLLAIEKRSQFAMDAMNWIANISKLLVAVSNAPACGEYERDALRESARWLVSVLSWVPDDKEAITLVERYQMTETIFEVAVDAYNRGIKEIGEHTTSMLLSWGFKAGKYEIGEDVMEQTCYGLASLTLLYGQDSVTLLASISEHLSKSNAPSQPVRERVAHAIRQWPGAHYNNWNVLSLIEQAMNRVDPNKLSPLLEEIAIRLSAEVPK